MSDGVEQLLATILGCGTGDIELLLEIDTDILGDAIENVKSSGLELNFPNVFREAVRVACAKYGIDKDEISEVDSNYLASRVYVLTKRAYEILNKLGFPVLMSSYAVDDEEDEDDFYERYPELEFQVSGIDYTGIRGE